MTYRFLAVNIDGALLRSNSKLSKSTRQSMEYLTKKGVEIALVTSRPYLSAQKIAKSLKLEGCLIAHDGAYISEVKKQKLMSRELAEDIVMQCIEALERFQCRIHLMYETHAVTSKEKQRNNLIAKMTLGATDQLYYPLTYVDSLYNYVMDEATGPLTMQIQFESSIQRKQALDMLEEQLDHVRIKRIGKDRLSLVSADVSKAKALQWLCQRKGIQNDELITIGAFEEDLEMMQMAGLGVAMGNAPKPLKDKADWITRSVDEDGLSYMIHEVFRKQLRINHSLK
ncbi:Cof-type HAD-IIB family hydrolase [Alkalicoccobacillus porphyridii]|uniref:Cof-type HAD-IIB family hydrolase n=1 Tax=Alkalicoccobacillus porphyridii TaxID=2597270 RepID=A0A553ZWF8_9BACI|nr:Cof-type HAD-IIB family hydrolase [Alkalicoccobacillus porphyridii]TSB45801.1 Cof-type HAD-IIB family hydrolase [Alkalicoccobacillus porphyridii]